MSKLVELVVSNLRRLDSIGSIRVDEAGGGLCASPWNSWPRRAPASAGRKDQWSQTIVVGWTSLRRCRGQKAVWYAFGTITRLDASSAKRRDWSQVDHWVLRTKSSCTAGSGRRMASNHTRRLDRLEETHRPKEEYRRDHRVIGQICPYFSDVVFPASCCSACGWQVLKGHCSRGKWWCIRALRREGPRVL